MRLTSALRVTVPVALAVIATGLVLIAGAWLLLDRDGRQNVLGWVRYKAVNLTAEVSPEAARTTLSEAGWAAGMPVFVRIFKQESELELWGQTGGVWALLKTYPICNWSGALGPKGREGDHQSPEGFYVVGARQLNPNSAYHLSFNLGFPNAVERAQGRTGSYLMIHGDCLSVGCYAMTDPAIEEIYRAVEAALDGGQVGVPVHAFPFRMTDAALGRHATHRHHEFWQTLKPGYDLFEASGAPPTVVACADRYAFAANGTSAPAGCQPLQAW